MVIRARSLLFTLAALAVAAQTAVAQRAPATGPAPAPMTEVIAVDPSVLVGRLPNGLQYFIRPNRTPRGRAELRLVVNAGAVLEDDDQRGLAHFVEHMAFNGTLNFPGQDIPAFMQSLGMRFGAHVNAHTGFDETVYELQIPTDNPSVIDRSLLIMEDWAHRVSFEPTEVEKERGVVLEEWRLGLGAESRIRDAQMPVLLKGARYADRSPIGRPEIIQNVSPARLKQFYADWYRPELMAVIVVGDVDPTAVEAMVRAHFAPIPPSGSARPRPNYAVPPRPDTLYSIVADREARGTTVTVFSVKPAGDQRTVSPSWPVREPLPERDDDRKRSCGGDHQEPQQAAAGVAMPARDALIDGVEMDVMPRQYRTFAELEQYCHRVASAVGLMSIPIFGYSDPKVRDYARDLGVALQLTNILRDVAVDYRRGRVYLPLEDLERFGCSLDDIRLEVERAGAGVQSARLRLVLEDGVVVTLQLEQFDQRTTVIPIDRGSYLASGKGLRLPETEEMADPIDLNELRACWTRAEEGPQGCKIRRLIPPGYDLARSQVGEVRFTARRSSAAQCTVRCPMSDPAE